MRLLSFLMLIFSIGVILVLLKQYLIMWIMLDKMGIKLLKYIVPFAEILLIIFADYLFLLPSVLVFLVLIYKYNILNNNEFIYYYHLGKEKFSFKKDNLIFIFLLSPLIFFLGLRFWKGFTDLIAQLNLEFPIIGYNYYNFNNSKQFIDYLGLFGVTCIIAPIVEEFTFRVLVYGNWLVEIFNKKIWAVLLSSIIFTISHFDINTVIYTFFIGIVLCFIYDGFGYLSTVFLHSLLNFYTFIVLYEVKIEEKTAIFIALVSLSLSYVFMSISNNKGNKVHI